MDDRSREESAVEMTPPHARRLARRTGDKVIGGVAGGLADYFGVDALWFRLGFVLAALLGGGGVLAYLILWAVLPEAGSTERTPLERHVERMARSLKGTPTWIGIVLLVLGGLLIVTQIVEWRPGVFWGLALVILGVLFFRQQETPAPAPAPEMPGLAATAPDAGGAVTPSPPPVPAAPSPPPIKRERSPLGWYTVGALLLAMGVAASLDQADVVGVTLVQYLALALAVLGVGLLAGAWIGRARWLVVPAILLVPFVLTASLIEVPFEGGSGERFFSPATVQEVRPEYRLVAGRILLDLHDITTAPSPLSIRMSAVAGSIVVWVPAGTPVEVHARVGAGHIDLFGRAYDGVKTEVRRLFPEGAVAAAPVFRLDLHTALGSIEVRAWTEEAGS